MPVAIMVMLALFGVVILALASYLIRVIRILTHVNDRLGKITFGVRAIAHRVEPVAELVGKLESDLGAVAGALEGLVAKTVADATSAKAA